MTHDATAPVTPDVSVQVDDAPACHAAAAQAGAEIVYTEAISSPLRELD